MKKQNAGSLEKGIGDMQRNHRALEKYFYEEGKWVWKLEETLLVWNFQNMQEQLYFHQSMTNVPHFGNPVKPPTIKLFGEQSWSLVASIQGNQIV